MGEESDGVGEDEGESEDAGEDEGDSEEAGENEGETNGEGGARAGYSGGATRELRGAVGKEAEAANCAFSTSSWGEASRCVTEGCEAWSAEASEA